MKLSSAQIIEQKVQQAVNPSHFELLNESHMHAGPATESHFKLIAVSDKFLELSLVKRHQSIYKLLKEELAGSVHALALHLYTEAEWQAVAELAPDSPKCAGNK